MTKLDKIKEVYGELYNSKEYLIDSNGWFDNSNEDDYITMSETNLLGECDYKDEYFFRPKSLNGIENNNGWIKIDNKDDLPKEDYGQYHVYSNNYFSKSSNQGIDDFWQNDDNKINDWLNNYIYYQPIIKQKPPIY